MYPMLSKSFQKFGYDLLTTSGSLITSSNFDDNGANDIATL